LYFELKMAFTGSIPQLQKNFKNILSQLKHFSWGMLSKSLLLVNPFLSHSPKRDSPFRLHPTS